MDLGTRLLSDVIHFTKFARWNEAEGRRETYEESVDRTFEMHRRRFPFLHEELERAKQVVLRKDGLPSTRSLHFGGEAIEKNHARIYHCSARALNGYEAFAEGMFLLLSGDGFGYSVQQHHLDQLPDVKIPTEYEDYVIADTIEGWAEAVKRLFDAYLNGSPIPVFDYSQIRAKGEPLVTSGGKAPGPEPLRKTLNQIGRLFAPYETGDRLTSIDAHDMMCRISEAVLSGGIRRSSMIAIFSLEDEDMLHAKSTYYDAEVLRARGDSVTIRHRGRVVSGTMTDYDKDQYSKTRAIPWWVMYPHRRAANNSVMMVRDEITKEGFDAYWKALVASGSGEPGMLLSNSREQITNPCQPAWATVLTPDGISTIGKVEIGDIIWSKDGWTTIVNKQQTGTKDVYEYQTNASTFVGTPNHRVFSEGEKVEVDDAGSIDLLSGSIKTETLDPQDIMDGLVLGDGSASNNLVFLYIGGDDQCYHQSEVSALIGKHRPGLKETAWEVTTTVQPEELPNTYDRAIPDRFLYGTSATVRGVLRGLFSANGSVCGNRVTLKTTSNVLARQVQLMLNSVGIISYITTKFQNGDYECKESYDVNISRDREVFYESIGFLHPTKMERLIGMTSKRGYKTTYEIASVQYVSTEPVFSLTVDNLTHSYWTGGCDVANCGEISLSAEGQMCNLTEVDVSDIESQEDLNERVWAAAFLATLQASYTDFHFLNPNWRQVTEEEALLGVGLTGIASGELEKYDVPQAARVALEVNQTYAAKIGIKPAARVTCVKPSGTSSLLLMCSSGIHAWHAPFFIKRLRINKLEPIAGYLARELPELVEEEEMDSNNIVLSLPIRSPDSAITIGDESAIDTLERVKWINQQWIVPGHRYGVNGHNCSCTIYVKPDEWHDVREWVWQNREFMNGVSFLPYHGGIYPQMPNEEITEEEYQAMLKLVKRLDLTQIREDDDYTQLQLEMACTAGACEL